MTNKVSTPADARIVGGNIRDLRKASKLTLKELSSLSGVSVATISKIETGKISGGFETIYKIARGLGVLVTDIMLAETTAAESIVVHASDGSDIHQTEIYDYFPQAYRRNGSLNTYIMQIRTREAPNKRDWSIHTGEEVIIVLSGVIDLLIEGSEAIRLEAGGSACFDCGCRHAFVSISPDDARIVSISTRGPTTRKDGHLVFSTGSEK
ncbi:MAG: helix-turn-helix transcriptional regulator [Amylibacter sp.]|nr:helix-turn-helix transcriptional regulator [Amylibacter sp.]